MSQRVRQEGSREWCLEGDRRLRGQNALCCHFLVAQPEAVYLISLNLSFLLRKMGIFKSAFQGY